MNRPHNSRRLVVAGLAVVLGVGTAWLWSRWHPVGEMGGGVAGLGGDRPVPTLADPTALVGLHEAGTAPRDDVRIVGAVLRNYLQSAPGPGAPPLGFNEDIVRALRGDNPLRVAFIPPDHPAIDAQGRLCDRWGTPYFFHPLAVDEIEVRSAGPDRKLFSGDDLVGSSAVE